MTKGRKLTENEKWLPCKLGPGPSIAWPQALAGNVTCFFKLKWLKKCYRDCASFGTTKAKFITHRLLFKTHTSPGCMKNATLSDKNLSISIQLLL